MPRVKIKRHDYMVKDFSKWLIGEQKVNGYTQADLAEMLGCSQQTISRKIRTGDFNVKELIILFEKFGTRPEEVGKVLINGH